MTDLLLLFEGQGVHLLLEFRVRVDVLSLEPIFQIVDEPLPAHAHNRTVSATFYALISQSGNSDR